MSIQFCNFSAAYTKHDKLVLEDISFTLNTNQTLFLIGPSGAGKSTLFLALFNALIRKQGAIYYENQDICQFNKRELKNFVKKISYLSANSSLLPDETVFESIKRELLANKPWWYQLFGYIKKTDIDAIFKILNDLGLIDKSFSPIKQLSQGQKQRVEIAKLLIKKPKIILADEPTTSLDIHNSINCIQLLQKQAQKYQCYLMIIIHDIALIEHFANPIIALKNGRLIVNQTQPNINKALWKQIYEN